MPEVGCHNVRDIVRRRNRVNEAYGRFLIVAGRKYVVISAPVAGHRNPPP